MHHTEAPDRAPLTRALIITLWMLVAVTLVVPAIASIRAADVELLKTSRAGTIPGTFSVSGNGAATYEIPIDLPPGTAGVAPKLALVYDSQAGNGYLGQGFSLRGVSAITRCTPTRPEPGRIHDINYRDDQFCLDGLPLVAVAGDYGAEGTVYYTERQTWTKVTSTGGCGGGPCSFEAWTEDGDRLEFGGTDDSRILAVSDLLPAEQQGVVRVWAQNRFEDRNGNRTDAAYHHDRQTGEYFVERIEYTANDRTGEKAKRRVDFFYEPRPDPFTRYQGGVAAPVTWRLYQIRTSVEERLVLAYSLQYAVSQDRSDSTSTLERISLCDGRGCLEGTELTFDSHGPYGVHESKLDLPNKDTCYAKDGAQASWIDFDADGRADFACVDRTSGRIRVWLSTGVGLDKTPLVLSSERCRSQEYQAAVVAWIDFNGDGRSDLLCRPPGSTERYVALSTGTSLGKMTLVLGWAWCDTYPGTQLAAWLDFDGDGRTDALCLGPGDSYYVVRSTGERFEPAAGGAIENYTEVASLKNWSCPADALGVLDFNGDGRADLQCSEGTSGRYRVMLSDGRHWVPPPGAGPDGLVLSGWSCTAPASVTWADFNGDRLADLLCTDREKGLYRVRLSTGRSLVPVPGVTDDVVADAVTCTGDAFARLQWNDFNGDGRVDLACTGGPVVRWVLFSRGEAPPGEHSLVPTSRTYGVGWQCIQGGLGELTFPDLAGTGNAGLACLDGFGSTVKTATLADAHGFSPHPPRLTRITDGLGGRTEITYAPLTDSAVYTPSSDPPTAGDEVVIRSVATPLYVVHRFTQSDAQGNSLRPTAGDVYAFEHHYGGALIEVGGQGWLGFAWVAMHRADPVSGRLYNGSTAHYYQDRPRLGLPRRIEHYDAAGAPASATEYDYRDVLADDGPLGQSIHQALLAEQRQFRYYGRAAVLALRIEYGYDHYGNLVSLFDHGDPDPSRLDDDLHVCTFYLVETDRRWRIGYPLEEKTTASGEGCQRFLDDAPQGRSTWRPGDLGWRRITYDDRMNVASDGTWDESHQKFLTVRYSVDDYGNVTSVIDPAGAETRFEYDSLYHTFVAKVTSPPNARGEVLTTTYETEPLFGQTLATRDPDGNVFGLAIDGLGRPREIHGPDPSGRPALLESTEYVRDGDTVYRETQWPMDWAAPKDSPAFTWQRVYTDGLGRSYRVERPAAAQGRTIVEESEFDDAGRPARRSLPRFDGDATYWFVTAYDERNRPTATTDPDGTVERIDYLAQDSQIRRTFAHGTPEARTEVSHVDATGRVFSQVSPNGLRREFKYDPLGRLVGVTTSPAKREFTFDYDSVGRLRAAASSDQGATSFTYDAYGRLARRQDAAGNWIENQSFDALGRVLSQAVSSPDGLFHHTLSYDDARVANGRGRLTAVSTSFEGDPDAGRPTSWKSIFGYDAYGRVQALAQAIKGATGDGSGAVAFLYDPLGRLREYVYPDGSRRRSEYWLDGSLQSSVLQEPDGADLLNAVLACTDETDSLGQWRRCEYGISSTTLERTFYSPTAATGKLRSIHAFADVAAPRDIFLKEYRWNRLGEVEQIATTRHGATSIETFGYEDDPANPHMGYLTDSRGPYGDQSYRYDLLGNRIALDDVAYDYDGETSRLASSSDGVRYGYYSNGDQMTKELVGGARLEFVFDARGLPVRIGVRASDDGGGPEAGTVRLGPAEHFRYDFLGRLLFRQAMDSTQTFWMPDFERTIGRTGSFDTLYLPGDGGPAIAVTRPAPAGSAANAAALARLYRRGGLRWAFFAAWAQARAWGLGPLLVALAFAAILSLVLFAAAPRRRPPSSRGAFGRLVRGGLRPAWVPLLIWGLLATPAPARAELEGGGRQEGIRYFLADHRGSAVAVIDPTGAETAYLSYLPFGGIDGPRSSGRDDFLPKFGGHEWLPSVGLYDFGARLYDPEVGRFITPDPAGQYLSPYLFGGDSPESVVDPDGRFAFLLFIILGAVLGAYMGASAVNHDFNPAHWDWKSGKTWAGLLGGAAIGAAGAAGGIAFAEAGVAAGIAGEAVIGAAENAAFTAMGGGSAKEILTSAAEGAVFGAAFGAVGAGLGSALGQFARRGAGEVEESLGEAGRFARRGGGALDDAKTECTCFAAGTEVATADGARAIETIEEGARVWARTDGESEPELQAVTSTFRRLAQDLVRVSVEGDLIDSTPEHRFWVDGRGWIAAGNLVVGDPLVDRAGKKITVLSLERAVGSQPVYNIEVERAHTYYVSGEQVLVHNPCYTRGTRRQMLDQGVDTRNVLGGRRATLMPNRLGAGVRRFGPPAPGMPDGRFVNFGRYVQRSARISYSGNLAEDFARADRQAFGSPGAGSEYRRRFQLVWHHSTDFNPETWEGTLQLIPRRIHAANPHYGGEYLARRADPTAYP